MFFQVLVMGVAGLYEEIICGRIVWLSVSRTSRLYLGLCRRWKEKGSGHEARVVGYGHEMQKMFVRSSDTTTMDR